MSDFEDLIKEAFPNEDWDESRLSALKSAIEVCMNSDYESEDDDDLEGPPSKSKGPDLALIFGSGKPKKKE